MKTALLATVAFGILAMSTAPFPLAQEHRHDMPAMDMGGMAMGSGDQGPAAMALRAANETMHRDMAITYTGKPDVDFVRGMIPHHQGAIDMAKAELQYGTDPDIRALAEEIVKAQEAEIAMMRAWLEKQGQ